MPTWLRLLLQGLGALPTPQPLWRPIYQAQQYVFGSDGSSAPINPQYLVDYNSAVWLATQFAATVVPVPFEGAGGPFHTGAIVYDLRWNDGLQMHAGLLAIYWCPAGPVGTPNSGYPPLAAMDDPSLPLRQAQAVIAVERGRRA